MLRRSLSHLSLALLAGMLSRAAAQLPAMPSPATSLVVEGCGKSGSGLSAAQSSGLNSRGFTKCVFGAFDVLVAGTAAYPDAYMLTTGNIIAELLDQDKDGAADGAARGGPSVA
jgi:hypothetical protein